MDDTDRTTHTPDDPRPLIDWTRTVDLDDQFTAMTTVAPDGTIVLWIFDEHHEQDTPCRGSNPVHEQLGRLPIEVRRRLNPCSVKVKHGERRGLPCTHPAEDGTDRCKRHTPRDQG